MAIKLPSAQASAQQKEKSTPSGEVVDQLVSELADKPYGKQGTPEPAKPTAKPRPLTISLPDVMVAQLEDLALRNKRDGKKPRTVSGLIREQLVKAGYKSQF